MKKLLFALVLCVLFSVPSFAEDQASAKPGMDPAAMEKMKAATSPNDNHKALDPFIGNWTYTAKFWMPGSEKAEESSGTSSAEWIYGGRFIKDTVKGTWMGQPFEGTGFTGYNNVRGEYESVWLDSGMTGICFSKGSFDAATKTFKYSGVVSCPLTGEKEVPCRSETVWADNDHYTITSWGTVKGEEHKGMELSFTRA